MKVSKKQNPHNVAVGQVWKRAKRNDRPNKFVVVKIEDSGKALADIISFFAVVEYGKGKTAYKRKINLLNFKDYTLVK